MGGTDGPEAITGRFEAAWNAHDMEAFAALFHSDATFVNRFATYWRNDDAIVAGHRGIHETFLPRLDAQDRRAGRRSPLRRRGYPSF